MALWPRIGTRYIQETFSPGDGLDSFRSPLQIRAGQASDMLNGSGRQYPALRTRDGRSALVAPIDEHSIRGIHVDPNGTIYMVCGDQTGGAGNELYYWKTSSDNWYLIETDAAGYTTFGSSFADWYDNSTGNWYVYTIRYDGTGPSVCKIIGSSITYIAYGTYPCRTGPICTHLNRMFTTPVSASGNLGYSKLADPTTWTSPDGGIIQVGKGENITALVSMNDRLFIGTDSGIYVLFGDSEENFTVQNVTHNMGIPNPQMAAGSNDSVFFSDGIDAFEYRNGTIYNISRSDNNNGVNGGFPAIAYPATDVARATGSRIVSVGANASKAIFNTTTTTAGTTEGYTEWMVFDIIRRRWYIEQGFHTNTESPNTVFCTSDWGRIIASSHYYTSSTTYEYPKLYELDAGTNYDNVNQYNLCADMYLGVANNFTAVGGADASAGSGQYNIVGDGSSAIPGFYYDTAMTIVSGHQVYAKVYVKVTNASCQSIALTIDGSTGGSLAVDSQATPVNGTWYELSGIVTLDGTTTGVIRAKVTATYINAGTANGKVLFCEYMIIDNVSFSHSVGNEPSVAQYEADLPSSYNYSTKSNRVNATSTYHSHPNLTYYSPKYIVRPSAKKTLANVWITVDTTNADDNGANAVWVTVDGTNWSYIYHPGTLPIGQNNLRIKVPIKGALAAGQSLGKIDFVQLKVLMAADVIITGITLDWRVVERTK